MYQQVSEKVATIWQLIWHSKYNLLTKRGGLLNISLNIVNCGNEEDINAIYKPIYLAL